MRSFERFWYKHKVKIITGALMLVVGIVALIVVLNKDEDNNIVDGQTPATDITAPVSVSTTPGVTPVDNYDTHIEDLYDDTKVVMLVKETGSDGVVKTYELLVNKLSNQCSIFENGTDTGTKSSYRYSVVGNLFNLGETESEEENLVSLESLHESKIAGTYEIDRETMRGVINYIEANGATKLLEVTTADYIDIYFSKTNGAKCRVLVTDGVLMYAEGEDIKLPLVENYLQRI